MHHAKYARAFYKMLALCFATNYTGMIVAGLALNMQAL